MRVAIVHYHLRPGGVTRVIQQSLTALDVESSAEFRCVVLAGEPPQATMPVPNVAVIPALGYDQTTTARSDVARELCRAATRVLGGPPDLWHIHNHALGKNLVVPALVTHFAQHGQRLLLHIHDFAEDGRSANYARLRQHLDDDPTRFALYPQGQHVHYAVLNPRDRQFLLAAGMSAAQLHDLPNPVSAETPTEERLVRLPAEYERLCLYPVRAIRRKNLGEFLLWAALADADELFAVSRAPQNPQEHAVYAQWVDFAAALRLPVQFALGERWAGSFQSLLQTAHVLMTTSVAEGFGLTFLEPWLAGRPLIGRKLPEITTAFERAGVDLTALYERLPIPLAWIDCECLRAAIQRELPRVYAAYGRSAGAAEVQRAYVAAIHDRTVDFGRLHEPLQQAVIQQLVNSPAMQAELRPYRNISAATACVQANCQQVAQCFNLQAYGVQLAQIYATVAASPLAPQPALNPQRLLDQFLSPERFCLLRT